MGSLGRHLLPLLLGLYNIHLFIKTSHHTTNWTMKSLSSCINLSLNNCQKTNHLPCVPIQPTTKISLHPHRSVIRVDDLYNVQPHTVLFSYRPPAQTRARPSIHPTRNCQLSIAITATLRSLLSLVSYYCITDLAKRLRYTRKCLKQHAKEDL